MSKRSRSSQSVKQSLHSRRSVIKHGGLLLGAMLLPWWQARRAQAGTASFDYYISPTGADSNPGTLSQPWAITAINTKQATYAGKRVGLLDGTYNIYSLVNGGSYLHAGLLVNGSTDPANPTVIQAVNARKAIIDAHNPVGGGYPTGQGAAIGVGQGDNPPNLGNVVLDGLVITGSNTFGIGFFCANANTSGNQGGATGIVIRNCELYDITMNSFGDNPAAIKLYYVTGVLVQNCRLHPMLNSGSPTVQGILTFNTRNNVYEYNTIYNAFTAWEEKEGPQGGSTMRYSYLEGYDSNLGTIRDAAGGVAGQTTTVHHCIIVGPSPWNNDDSLTTNSESAESLVCYNCTVYYGSGDFPTSGLKWYSRGNLVSPTAQVTLYNNIYYCSGPGSIGSDVLLSGGTVTASDYNSYRPITQTKAAIYTRPAGGGSYSSYTLPSWRTTTGFDGHSIAANPNFTNPTSGNPAGYQLASGSPCIGAGRVGGVPTGAACNMGAWDGTATHIGCDFESLVAGTSTPNAPVLSVS